MTINCNKPPVMKSRSMAFLALSGPCKGPEWFDGIWIKIPEPNIHRARSWKFGCFGTQIGQGSHAHRIGLVMHLISSHKAVFTPRRSLFVVTCYRWLIVVLLCHFYYFVLFTIACIHLCLIIAHLYHELSDPQLEKWITGSPLRFYAESILRTAVWNRVHID